MTATALRPTPPDGSLRIAPVALVVLLTLTVQALTLAAMGQPLVCTCGVIRIWQGDVLGPENSQQLIDWYTPSHVIHGILFFFVFRWLLPRRSPLVWLILALGVEVGWELLENSPPVIARYRQQALAQGYVGDSIVNSLSDTIAATLGFLLAYALPTRVTIAFIVAAEIFTAVMVRDNLTLNVIQLIHPVEAISTWQMGLQGHGREDTGITAP